MRNRAHAGTRRPDARWCVGSGSGPRVALTTLLSPHASAIHRHLFLALPTDRPFAAVSSAWEAMRWVGSLAYRRSPGLANRLLRAQDNDRASPTQVTRRCLFPCVLLCPSRVLVLRASSPSSSAKLRLLAHVPIVLEQLIYQVFSQWWCHLRRQRLRTRLVGVRTYCSAVRERVAPRFGSCRHTGRIQISDMLEIEIVQRKEICYVIKYEYFNRHIKR